MKNWWRTAEDYHRLPQTATNWLVLLHWTFKPISGSYYIYIPDSTNYKSTASGAKNSIFWIELNPTFRHSKNAA